jgi:hypothetical protein
MSYHILVTVRDTQTENVLFTADTLTVDRAIEELGRFERKVWKRDLSTELHNEIAAMQGDNFTEAPEAGGPENEKDSHTHA